MTTTSFAIPGIAHKANAREVRGRGEWPFYLVCVWAPVWWAMGALSIAFLVLMPFMVVSLARRARPLRLPRVAIWWFAFLTVVVAGVFSLGRTAPGTISEGRGSQLLPWFLNLTTFVSATVVLVWICSHDRKELPLRRLLGYFGVLGVWTVVGGFLGVFLPDIAFKSPTEILLRTTIGDGPWLALINTPRSAQVQDIFGETTSARPAAPFPYTNSWGQMLSLLLVLGFAAWWTSHEGWSRLRRISIIALAMIPALLSLNRGLWIGLIVTVCWVIFALIRRGRYEAVFAMLAAVLIGIAVLAISPAGQLVRDRSDAGHSDAIRSSLAADAVTGAGASPIIGWGGMRQIQGSPQSIAIGSTSDCEQCGNRRIGSTGLFWYMIFAHGYLGAGLFVGLILSSLWRYRRDTTVIGFAASGVLVLSLLYMFTYTNISLGLVVTLSAIGVLYRNEVDHTDV